MARSIEGVRFPLTNDEHVESLATAYGIQVRRDEADWHAGPNERFVVVPMDLADDNHYLVALHELGHVVTDSGADALEREWAAWAWAFNHARCELTTELLHRSWVDSFGSYFDPAAGDALDALAKSMVARWRDEDDPT